MFEDVRTVAVYVSDTERAKRFYIEILGFQLRVQVHESLCFLASASGRVHVYLEGGHRAAPNGPDATRLGFFLETEGPARDAFDRLKEAGVTLLDEAPEEVGDGVFVFRFLDPDGNVLEATGGPPSKPNDVVE